MSPNAIINMHGERQLIKKGVDEPIEDLLKFIHETLNGENNLWMGGSNLKTHHKCWQRRYGNRK